MPLNPKGPKTAINFINRKRRRPGFQDKREATNFPSGLLESAIKLGMLRC